MMLCPNCKSPDMHFEIDRHTASSVTIDCDADGDYHERSEFVHHSTWDRVLCLSCDTVIDEMAARDLFDQRQQCEPMPDDDAQWFLTYWHPDGGTGEGGHWSSENGCHEQCPACKEV